MSGNPCGNQNNKSLYEMPTTFVIKYEPNHSDCISKSSIPPLPDGWCGPWEADQDGNLWGMRHGRLCDFAVDCGFKNAQFLADLLNVTHPGPAKKSTNKLIEKSLKEGE